MTQPTDTRAKTREAYKMFVARGEHPSARQILRFIGSGSLSTISDELSKIGANARLEPVSAPAADGPKLPPVEANNPPDVSLELARLRESLAQLAQTMGAIQTELSDLRISSKEQLAVAYERYESVQRMALQQVDIARQEARDYKTRLATVSLDAETREDAMRGRSQQLREENQRLIGRIEELVKRNQELSASAQQV